MKRLSRILAALAVTAALSASFSGCFMQYIFVPKPAEKTPEKAVVYTAAGGIEAPVGVGIAAAAPVLPGSITAAIYEDIRKRHFAAYPEGDTSFAGGVELIRMHPSWVGHVTFGNRGREFTKRVHLPDFARDKRYIAITDDDGVIHVALYNRSKRVYDHITSTVRLEIIKRLYNRPTYLPAAEAAARVPETATTETFERDFGGAVDAELWTAAKKFIDAIPYNGQRLVKALYMCETLEEKNTALWLIPKLDKTGFLRLYENKAKLRKDVPSIDPQTLYENVHYAHRAWKEFAWGKDVSEEDFRTLVLPHRGSGEPLERWRRHFYNAIYPAIAGMTNVEDAAYMLLCLSADLLRYRYDMTFEDVGIMSTLLTHEGRCEDMTNLVNALFRAAGIPSGHVYTPCWAKADGNHAWSGAWIGSRTFSFMGCEMPRSRDCFKKYTGKTNAGKVYVGELFVRKDVTDQYTTTADIEFLIADPSKLAEDKKIYLGVFNHGDWRSIASAEADEDGNIKFEKVGCRDIMYLLTYNRTTYYAGEPEYATGPFILEEATEMARMLSNTMPAQSEELESALEFTPIGKITPEETYKLYAWGGNDWQEVQTAVAGSVETEDGKKKATLTMKGELNRLYILTRAGKDGNDPPVGRPFEIKAVETEAGTAVKAVKY